MHAFNFSVHFTSITTTSKCTSVIYPMTHAPASRNRLARNFLLIMISKQLIGTEILLFTSLYGIM